MSNSDAVDARAEHLAKLQKQLDEKKEAYAKLSEQVLVTNQDFLMKTSELKKKKHTLSKRTGTYVDDMTELAKVEAALKSKRESFNSKLSVKEEFAAEHSSIVAEHRDVLEKCLLEYKDCKNDFKDAQRNISQATDMARIETLNLIAFCKYAKSMQVSEIRKIAEKRSWNSKKDFSKLWKFYEGSVQTSRKSLANFYIEKNGAFRRQQRILSGKQKEHLEVSIGNAGSNSNANSNSNSINGFGGGNNLYSSGNDSRNESAFDKRLLMQMILPNMNLNGSLNSTAGNNSGISGVVTAASGISSGAGGGGHRKSIFSAPAKGLSGGGGVGAGAGHRRASMAAVNAAAQAMTEKYEHENYYEQVGEEHISFDDLKGSDEVIPRDVLDYCNRLFSAHKYPGNEWPDVVLRCGDDVLDLDQPKSVMSQRDAKHAELCVQTANLAGKRKELTSLKEGLDNQLLKQVHLLMLLCNDIQKDVGAPIAGTSVWSSRDKHKISADGGSVRKRRVKKTKKVKQQKEPGSAHDVEVNGAAAATTTAATTSTVSPLADDVEAFPSSRSSPPAELLGSFQRSSENGHHKHHHNEHNQSQSGGHQIEQGLAIDADDISMTGGGDSPYIVDSIGRFISSTERRKVHKIRFPKAAAAPATMYDIHDQFLFDEQLRLGLLAQTRALLKIEE